MSRPAQIAVIGSSASDAALVELAEEVGRCLAEAAVRVVCGGLTGVMEGAARGASAAGGEVIGIVPGTSTAEANEFVTHPVATGIGYARNLAVVASGDAVIAIGGEWGTLSEIAHARQFGRPVIALSSWAVRGWGPMESPAGIEIAETPEQAVQLALAAIDLT